MQLTQQELQIIRNVIDDEIDKSEREYRHKFYDEFILISKKLDFFINYGSADADSSNEPTLVYTKCQHCGHNFSNFF